MWITAVMAGIEIAKSKLVQYAAVILVSIAGIMAVFAYVGDKAVDEYRLEQQQIIQQETNDAKQAAKDRIRRAPRSTDADAAADRLRNWLESTR